MTQSTLGIVRKIYGLKAEADRAFKDHIQQLPPNTVPLAGDQAFTPVSL